MKIEAHIDLRERHPLGLDVTWAYHAAFDIYEAARRMGPADPKKPGWSEHQREYERKIGEARRLHGVLLALARLVGDHVAAKIPALKWARNTDYLGQPRVQGGI